ncbi:VOC family protein [Saccharopolyspora shandongensis]|uniref:VOC family protein n=1 Tax=Saccharopolyspora shandongensis TaxID=418495 RepID=UPI0033D50D15
MFREAFPILSTPDLGRAMRFYCDVLGFEPHGRRPGRQPDPPRRSDHLTDTFPR